MPSAPSVRMPLPPQSAVAAVLLLLAEAPAHGYAVQARLAELGPPGCDLAGCYRLLRALDEAGLVASRWLAASGGPPRRLYQLTPAGVASLHDRAAALRQGHDALGGYLARYARLARRRVAAAAGAA